MTLVANIFNNAYYAVLMPWRSQSLRGSASFLALLLRKQADMTDRSPPLPLLRRLRGDFRLRLPERHRADRRHHRSVPPASHVSLASTPKRTSLTPLFVRRPTPAGPQVFRAKYAPNYRIPFTVCMVFQALAFIAVGTCWYVTREQERETRRVTRARRREEKEGRVATKAVTEWAS